jgi:hypothetical protein
MSALIMLPVNILLVTIFKNVRPRYARNMYHEHLDTLTMHLAFKSIKDGEYSVFKHADMESLISESQSYYLRSELVDLDKISTPFVYPHTVESWEMTQEELARESAIRETAVKQRQTLRARCSKFLLPWWFVYINWVSQS